MLGQVPSTPPSEGFFHDLTLLLPNFILALHAVSGLFLKYIFFQFPGIAIKSIPGGIQIFPRARK